MEIIKPHLLARFLIHSYNLFMNLSFHLFQLQKIDSQLDQIDQRLKSIQKELDNDDRLENARQIVAAANEKLTLAQKELKKIELEVESKQVKLEQSESTLYSGVVKMPKELQDLQNEVNSIKKAIGALEDRQLEAMVFLEEMQSELKNTQSNQISVQAIVSQDQSGLMGEKNKLENDRERLLVERSAVLPQIQPESLAHYNGLRQKKRGIAVAAVVDSSCTACGSTLTPAECQAARSPATTTYCSSCGRIIYAG